MALIPFSTGDHDNPGFVEKLKQLVFPDLEPENLQFPHARFIQNGLLAAQTFVECLRSNNVNFYDLDDVTVSCKIATLIGPEHARIQSVYAYNPTQKCYRHHYEQKGVGAIGCYGDAVGGCVASESAADIVFNSVMSGVAFCNQDDVVISESGFKCCDRIFAKGACDKIYLAPMFPCDWRVAVHWEGIKRRYENADLIADDEDLLDVISLYLRGERAGMIDRDLETQQLIMRKPSRAGDWGGLFWQRLMDMKHRCREERRLRRNYLCDAIFDDNALVDPCELPEAAVPCGVNQYEANGVCHDCFTPEVTISASDETIESTGSVTISWTSNVPDIDSSVVTVEYGDTVTTVVRNVDGSIVLNPQVDTIYTIRAVTVCGTVSSTLTVTVTVVEPCICPEGLPDCLQLDVAEPSEIFLGECGYTLTTDGYGAVPWDGTMPQISACRYGWEGSGSLYLQPGATPVNAIMELISCDPFLYRLSFKVAPATYMTAKYATYEISETDFYIGKHLEDGSILADGDRVLLVNGTIPHGEAYGTEESGPGIWTVAGGFGVRATDADSYNEVNATPWVLVTEGAYTGKYFKVDLSHADSDMLIKYDLVELWQGDSAGVPVGPFSATTTGCALDESFSLTSCVPCDEPSVTFDPPSGSHVSFPTLVFIHSTNNNDSIYYGIDEDAINLYTGPISLQAGQVLTARSFTALGCQSEIVTASYVEDTDNGLLFVFLCDSPNDKAGVFNEFHPNGADNDYHWQIKPSRTAPWTLHNAKIYETNAKGVWVTGQVWSTVSPVYPVEISPAAYASYPLVLFNGVTQINSSYTDPLVSYGSGTQTLMGYGQPFVALTGYFRLELTIEEGGAPFTIYKLIPHACAECVALTTAPLITVYCDGTQEINGTVSAGATFRILRAVFAPCGSGIYEEILTGISVDGSVAFVATGTPGCTYGFIFSQYCVDTEEWTNSPASVVTMPQIAPVLGSLTVSPEGACVGDDVTVSWTLTGGTPSLVTVDGVSVTPALSGSSSVTLTTVPYEIEFFASNTCGEVSDSVTVTDACTPPSSCVPGDYESTYQFGGNAAAILAEGCVLNDFFSGTGVMTQIAGLCVWSGNFSLSPSRSVQLNMGLSGGIWELYIIDAVQIWYGTKSTGLTPSGTYTRVSGCINISTFAVT